MKIDKLLLQTGGDIPFPPAGVTIHTPCLKEISFIGEKNFHIGCHFLNFDKNNLSDEDKINLADKSDFEIFMSVMSSRENLDYKTDAIMVLALLFPQYKIKIDKDKILLQLNDSLSSINEQNYDAFKEILVQMFCLQLAEGEEEYDPADALANRIAEKIKKGKMKRNKKELKDDNLFIYDKFISILSVGLRKSKETLSQYTVYQIRDEFQRFIKKENYDLYVKEKLAGAQDLEEVKNWMDDDSSLKGNQ